jgi:hypothetical protein
MLAGYPLFAASKNAIPTYTICRSLTTEIQDRETLYEKTTNTRSSLSDTGCDASGQFNEGIGPASNAVNSARLT